MKNQYFNPPKNEIKNWRRKTTLTALSTFRQRCASVPPACRHFGRQRSLQEMGYYSTLQKRDDREDLGRKWINLVEICAFTNHILNSSKMTSSEVQQ